MDINERGDKVLMNTYGHFPICIEKGEGVYLYDSNGKKYLDFVAGIAVNTLGSGNIKLIKAISEQAEKLIHCSNLYYTLPQIELAEMLTANTAFDKVFFCNSGAEAIECMLKLCRKYAATKSAEAGSDTAPSEIIAMQNSFHGRTYGSLTLTAQPKYHKGFEPLLPDIKYVPYNDFKALLSTISGNTAAIIMEVIQGEGGIIPAEKEYLKKVRELCNETGVLLVFDEIQTGIGRSGHLYAHQAVGITPDIITSAKGLAGGVPIGAVLARDFAAKSFAPGDHGSTFGGNPLACSAALAVLDELLNNGLLDHIKDVGEYLGKQLNSLKNKNNSIKDVRGVGLMRGIELYDSVSSNEIINKCIDHGLLLIGAGKNVIRFVPPLTIEKSHIDKAIATLSEALK